MYRGYDQDWDGSRQRPAVPRPVFQPPAPAEVLPPGDPGGQSDYQRRFPLRPIDTPQPRHLPPAGPRPPMRRAPAGIPVGALLRAATFLNDWDKWKDGLAGPIGYGGFDKVLSCDRPPSYGGFNDRSVTNVKLLPVYVCLAGQASAGPPWASPLTTTRSITHWYAPHFALWDGGAGPWRSARFELFVRDNNGTMPIEQHSPGPTVRTLPGVYPRPGTWVTPAPMPWPLIPYLVNTGLPESSVRGNEQKQIGNSIAYDNPSPGIAVSVRPATQPEVEGGIKPYVPDPSKSQAGFKVRELKGRLGFSLRGLIYFRDSTTEGVDLVDAFWESLPQKVRTKFARENYGHGPIQWTYRRTRYLISHADQIDLDKAIRNVIVNDLEDRIYGRYFQARRRAFQRHGYWDHSQNLPTVENGAGGS